MKIKKNDQVLIITGKDRGKKGKVLKCLPKSGRVVIENINFKKKHIKPRKQGEKGRIIEIAMPVDVSNVKLICSKCGKTTRIGYKISDKNKLRICKKCGEGI